MENVLGDALLTCATRVHRALGPGLLESVYETCLALELERRGVAFKRQLSLPVAFAGQTIKDAYRLDFLIDDLLVIEVKAVDRLNDVHRAQLLSYVKLGGYRLGYLLNFNTALLKDGICRMVNGL